MPRSKVKEQEHPIQSIPQAWLSTQQHEMGRTALARQPCARAASVYRTLAAACGEVMCRASALGMSLALTALRQVDKVAVSKMRYLRGISDQPMPTMAVLRRRWCAATQSNVRLSEYVAQFTQDAVEQVWASASGIKSCGSTVTLIRASTPIPASPPAS